MSLTGTIPLPVIELSLLSWPAFRVDVGDETLNGRDVSIKLFKNEDDDIGDAIVVATQADARYTEINSHAFELALTPEQAAAFSAQRIYYFRLALLSTGTAQPLFELAGILLPVRTRAAFVLIGSASEEEATDNDGNAVTDNDGNTVSDQ